MIRKVLIVFQGVYCVNKLGLDPAKVNPRGGAMSVLPSIVFDAELMPLLQSTWSSTWVYWSTPDCHGFVGVEEAGQESCCYIDVCRNGKQTLSFECNVRRLIRMQGMGMAGVFISEH